MPVDKSENRIRTMFGQIAGRYDFLNHLLSLNADRYWRWRTVRIVPPDGTGPILDVCTGTGDLALAYFRASGRRAEVVGSDFCHPMLEIAKRKGRQAGANGRVRWVEADSQQLPFPDNQFQIVAVAFGLRNITDMDRGLREMVRVCSPGGRVAILEFSLPRRQPFRGIYAWYFRNVLPRIGRLLSKSRLDAYNYLPESVGEFPQGEALKERMTQAGLVDVLDRPLTLGVATLYFGTKPEKSRVERKSGKPKAESGSAARELDDQKES